MGWGGGGNTHFAAAVERTWQWGANKGQRCTAKMYTTFVSRLYLTTANHWLDMSLYASVGFVF